MPYMAIINIDLISPIRYAQECSIGKVMAQNRLGTVLGCQNEDFPANLLMYYHVGRSTRSEAVVRYPITPPSPPGSTWISLDYFQWFGIEFTIACGILVAQVS